MDVFELRHRLIGDYARYVDSFIHIREPRVRDHVQASLGDGVLWPDPLIQLNPSFEPGNWIDNLVRDGVLHQDCAGIFRRDKGPSGPGESMRLHRHQSEAVRTASGGHNYVLTTGTGSGKSLAYIVPIVDRVLRERPRRGIQAIVVYPMNALVNSQANELQKFLELGFPAGRPPVTFGKYTGQERGEARRDGCNVPLLILMPPDRPKKMPAADESAGGQSIRRMPRGARRQYSSRSTTRPVRRPRGVPTTHLPPASTMRAPEPGTARRRTA